MSQIITWCSFVGAWLLVIGPIYQAAIDINDEDFDREEFARALADVPRPPEVSRWWLLVPPVAYLLRARRHRRYREILTAALTPTQLEQVMHFRETTSAWMFVAAGGSLLAVAETWGLHEDYHWPDWAFWALLLGMVVVSIASTAARVHRRMRIVGSTQR